MAKQELAKCKQEFIEEHGKIIVYSTKTLKYESRVKGGFEQDLNELLKKAQEEKNVMLKHTKT